MKDVLLAIIETWNTILSSDKAMVIFVVWTFGVFAFWKVADPSTIISNITSGLFGLVTGIALEKAK
jgi:hypothetical protein